VCRDGSSRLSLWVIFISVNGYRMGDGLRSSRSHPSVTGAFLTVILPVDGIEATLNVRYAVGMARPEGGSWAARIAALVIMFGCVGLTLFAGWNLVRTPYGWPTLSWAGGLVAGVVATPYVLLGLYWATVRSTWRHHAGLIVDATDNRLWWLGQFMKAVTLPYGLLAITSVFGWRLSMGNYVPLPWRWCVVIIAANTLLALIASGGIPGDPEMPFIRQIKITWPGVFLGGGIAAIIFAVTHFVHLKWLHIVLFVIVFALVAFWASIAAMAAIQLFLRVDHGTSTSHPID
jgi:hypothetical protein